MPDKAALLSPLLQLLNKIQPIETELENHLISSFEPKLVKKGEVLLREGEVCKNLWFLANGLLRSYHIIGRKETTSRIMFTNHIVIAPGSFFTQTPATESIQALSNSMLLTLSFERLQTMYSQYPLFNYHTRLITEDYFFKQEQRLYMLRKHSAADKYKYFETHYGSYLKDIPQKHVASFLNIARETYNRIRNNKNKGSSLL